MGESARYTAWYPTLEGSPSLLLGIRILGALVVLFIPTFLMGGTYPILVAGTANSEQEVSKRVSQLYWSNTAGAVLGTLLAGFMLLPFLGLRLTITCAVAINVICGLAARSVRIGESSGQIRPLCRERMPRLLRAPDGAGLRIAFVFCERRLHCVRLRSLMDTPARDHDW
jgi:MFS family permease